MVSFEDAKKIALERNKEYNRCQKYEDAYYFYLDDGIMRDGGDVGIIVEKETGEIIRPYMYFIGSKRRVKEVGELVVLQG